MRNFVLIIVLLFSVNSPYACGNEKMEKAVLYIFNTIKNVDNTNAEEYSRMFVSIDDIEYILNNDNVIKSKDIPLDKVRKYLTGVANDAHGFYNTMIQSKSDLQSEYRVDWNKMKLVGYYCAKAPEGEIYNGRLVFSIDGKKFNVKIKLIYAGETYKATTIKSYISSEDVNTEFADIYRFNSNIQIGANKPDVITDEFFKELKNNDANGAEFVLKKYRECSYNNLGFDLTEFSDEVGDYISYKTISNNSVNDTLTNSSFNVKFQQMDCKLNIQYVKQNSSWLVNDYSLEYDKAAFDNIKHKGIQEEKKKREQAEQKQKLIEEQNKKSVPVGADSISVITASFFNALENNNPEKAISEFNKYTEFKTPETDSEFIDVFNKSGDYVGYYMSGKMYFGDKNSVEYNFSMCFKKMICEIDMSLIRRDGKWFVNNYYIKYDYDLLQKINNNDAPAVYNYNNSVNGNSSVEAYCAAEIIWHLKDNPEIKDNNLDLEQSALCNKKQYFSMKVDGSASQLWSIDKNSKVKHLLGQKIYSGIEKKAKSELKIAKYAEQGAYYSRGVKELVSMHNRLYFTYNTGEASNRLLQYSPSGNIKPIDGVTSVQSIKPWGDNLVMEGVSDNGIEGLFLLDSNGVFKNRLEYEIEFPAQYDIAVIDTMAQVFTEKIVYQLYKKELLRRFKFPDTLRIIHTVNIDKGLFIETQRVKLKNGRQVQNAIRDYFIQESLTTIIDCRNLPVYMRGVNPVNINSVNGTIYFNLESDNGKKQTLYYKNFEEYGNITDKFNKHNLDTKDVLTDINGNLLIKREISHDSKSYNILQLYDIKNDVIKNVGIEGSPVGVNIYSGSFLYNGYVYFIGSYGTFRNCLLRYNGVDDPEKIEVVR